MTQEHPITPPPELVQQWITEIWHEGTPVRVAASDLHIATQAARWGSDQELEACISAILDYPGFEHPELFVEVLRAARRPEPPSLKELALAALNEIEDKMLGPTVEEKLIRRALEQLPD